MDYYKLLVYDGVTAERKLLPLAASLVIGYIRGIYWYGLFVRGDPEPNSTGFKAVYGGSKSKYLSSFAKTLLLYAACRARIEGDWRLSRIGFIEVLCEDPYLVLYFS